MIILSIETSCDETAVSIVEATGEFPHATYRILGNALFSQIDIHREYGGVFPAVAKREHAKTLVPMLARALEEAKLPLVPASPQTETDTHALRTMLEREPDLADALIAFFNTNGKPPIDLIAVTHGPGLEPALWVGINFARALATVWNIPVAPINHMEGHIFSSILTNDHLPHITFPALALLISGGHTELVRIDDWAKYTRVGETRDDAVGEAFDKVARMLGLPYPGGPEISDRARSARSESLLRFTTLPRPMIDSDNLDFSFSGLKTAVRYAIQGKELSDNDIASIAREFEDSVTEVLLKKTARAIEQYDIQTLIVGGGVSANAHIRTAFASFFETNYADITVFFPPRNLSTDNSIMIAIAGHAHAKESILPPDVLTIRADGNLAL